MPFKKNKYSIKPGKSYLIIGGGASGIMCAYQLHQKYPNSTITILEQNEFTFNDYLKSDYDKLDNWAKAYADGNYNEKFQTIDTPPETALVGKGLGGGTLLFGLQYINTEMVIKQNYSDWLPIFIKISQLLAFQRYTYPPQKVTDGITSQQIQLKNSLETVSGFKTFNNLIYSREINNNSRYLLANLINNIPTIKVKYNIKITSLILENEKIVSVVDSNQLSYTADHYILAAGTLNSCILLKKLGLNVGNNIFDHAGVTITYLPPINIKSKNTDTDNYVKVRHRKLLDDEIEQINNRTFQDEIILKPILKGSNDIRRDYLYDFGDFFINLHPGGNIMPLIKANDNYLNNVLNSCHGLDGAFDRIINRAGARIVFNKQKQIVSNPIGHLQTRSLDNSWQTYYSYIPSQPVLILTYAQANLIPGKGVIGLDKQNQPILKLNHFGLDNNESQYITPIIKAYQTNDKVLNELGYQRLEPGLTDNQSVVDRAKTIYHYHGGCSEIVDDRQYVEGIDNLSIADISILPKPFGGSTSSIALVTGYKCAEYL